ncbi:MAG TPA: TIM barrel protein [Planctomycetota bacterium]|nr:TIM barrel protein [Planctomycetota bacterium]HRR81213.1 TIM barrel protein [Planctomycetota bacterium]HRT93556.1 TIM barrel protein [Planctomycetota bacterium]
MNVCIASFSFHGLIGAGMMDVFGYLESCKYRYHLDAADIWNGLLGRDEKVYLQDDFLKKVKEALAEREMCLANYHADGCHPWDDKPEVRDKNHASALAHLRAAAFLGAKTMRIDAGGKGNAWTNEQFDYIVKRMREYCQIGGDAGFRVGPESHWGPELVPDNMERLARAVDHPAFGILLHIGHWEGAPEEEGDRRLAPWACHTHVDARITRTRLEPAMRTLLDAGYQGYWGVEHHSAKNEYAEVAYQLAEVRRVLEKMRQG